MSLRLGIYASAKASDGDPLAGIEFSARWQSHVGDDVPLGYYQDEACTIPAVTEFDLVVAVKDELSGSGLIMTQSDPDKQMLLRFTAEGVPYLESDGVDDYYEMASVAGMGADNWSVVVAVATNDLSGTRVVTSIGSDVTPTGYAVTQRTGKIAFLRNGLANEPSTTDWVVDEPTVVSVIRNAGTVTLYANGVALSPTYSNAPNAPTTASFIGWNGGDQYWSGPIFAVFWFNAVLSVPEHAAVVDYLVNEILP